MTDDQWFKLGLSALFNGPIVLGAAWYVLMMRSSHRAHHDQRSFRALLMALALLAAFGAYAVLAAGLIVGPPGASTCASRAGWRLRAAAERRNARAGSHERRASGMAGCRSTPDCPRSCVAPRRYRGRSQPVGSRDRIRDPTRRGAATCETDPRGWQRRAGRMSGNVTNRGSLLETRLHEYPTGDDGRPIADRCVYCAWRAEQPFDPKQCTDRGDADPATPSVVMDDPAT